MAFTYNYTDIEIVVPSEIDRRPSTKSGISRILSLGLGHQPYDENAVQKTKKNFKIIRKILKFTWLYLEDSKNESFGFYMGLIRVFMIVVLATYKILFTLGYLIYGKSDLKEYSHTSSGVIVVLSWSMKSWFTMIFLIYWQYKGYISNLFLELNKFNRYCSSKTAKTYIIKIVILAIITFLFTVNASVVHSVLAHLGYRDRAMLDKRAQQIIFYFWFSPYLSNLITLLSFIIWVLGLSFYVIVLRMLAGELECFNKGLKKTLENAPKNDLDSILLERYSVYLKMTDLVLQVNNIFEVYTFVMVGLNIPTSMFTLISFVVGLKASWETAVFSVPTIVFSIIELYGLTHIPAKVHATIRKIPNILYGTHHLWNPYNEKTYHIANTFMDHINQNDLGISLWGFAIVTKPLILTTLSAIVTYLTILVQMKGTSY